MKQEGYSLILIIFGVVVSLLILLIPQPYYQSEDLVCKPGQLNCPERGWHFNSPLYQQILQSLISSTVINQQNIDITATPTVVNSVNDLGNTTCEIDQEYRSTAVNPVACNCPEGSNKEIISQSFGSCPDDNMRDCPTTTFKCSNPSRVPTRVQSNNYLKPSNWKDVTARNVGLAFCLPPKWESDENGYIVFNRDSGYKPDVATMSVYPYQGGSRREEFINLKVRYEPDSDKLKKETQVKELTINGLSVLDITIPTFPEAYIFNINNKLYEISLASWNLVNDSETSFKKDIYTMIGCVKSI